MTHFTTCVGCISRDGCARLDRLKAALKGSGVTSLKHRCPERQCMFFYGQPVIVTTFSGEMEEVEYGSMPVMGEFPGYFLKQQASRGICFIKAGAVDINDDEMPFVPKGRGFAKIPLSRIRPNPDGVVLSTEQCILCHDPIAITGRCGGFENLADAGTLCAMKKAP